MAQVSDLVRDRKVYSITSGATAVEAARYMTENRIGAVPVMQDGELVGVFTERDLMTRVIAAGRSPGITKVSEVMTSNPRTVPPDETIDGCLFIMKELGFRHLLICEGKLLRGQVSLRDILLAGSKTS